MTSYQTAFDAQTPATLQGPCLKAKERIFLKERIRNFTFGPSKRNATAEGQASGLPTICKAGKAFSTLSELLGRTQ